MAGAAAASLPATRRGPSKDTNGTTPASSTFAEVRVARSEVFGVLARLAKDPASGVHLRPGSSEDVLRDLQAGARQHLGAEVPESFVRLLPYLRRVVPAVVRELLSEGSRGYSSEARIASPATPKAPAAMR